MQAPSVGAVRYTYRLSKRSDTAAGASERAGFIDAPEIGPANSASRAITDPTATPAKTPFSFEPVETLRITNISRKVRTASSTKDCMSLPAGRVAPSVAFVGNMHHKVRLARTAPAHWLAMYGPTQRASKRRAAKK